MPAPPPKTRPKTAARAAAKTAAKTPQRQAPRKRRDYLDADERRRQLLEVGIEAFARTPYDQVAIDEVARHAGVSKGLLYHYFETKHGFYTAVVEAAAEQLFARVVLDRALPYEERLRRGLDSYLEAVDQRGATYTAVVRGGVGSDPAIGAIVQRTRQRFIDKFLAEMPPVPDSARARIVFHGWVGYVEATSVQWIATRELTRAELRDHLAEVLLLVFRSVVVPR